MGNDDRRPVEQPIPLSLLLLFLVLTFVSFVFLILPDMENLDPDRPLSVEKNIGISEIIGIGRQDLEHEDLLSRIRKDLKIPVRELLKFPRPN